MRRILLWLGGCRALIDSHRILRARLARQAEEIELLERQRAALIDLLDRLKWTACADSAAAKGFIEHLGGKAEG